MADREPVPRAPTLLIVDDVPANVRALARLLSGPYALRVATTGEDALEIARNQRPDLILLDVELPDLDGLEVCRRLKDQEATADIPVIFVTARSEETDEIAGLALGAVDYIVKPYSPAIVRARVNTHLELKRYRDLLLEHSFIDGLTGVPNRRRFDQYLRAAWDEARTTDGDLAVVMADVDCFKAYNDCYGHLAGDHCLRRIAAALRDVPRRRSDLLARYGGEEFACVLPEADRAIASQVAEALRATVEELAIEHRGNPGIGRVTLSVGCASTSGGRQARALDLVEAADRALYVAKQGGRNRVQES